MMALTRRDAVGLALAVCTVGVLVAHGGGRHDEAAAGSADDVGPAPVGVASSTSTLEADAEVLAFVDVNLIAPAQERSRGHQVVVVRDGLVTRVGAVGSVGLPPDARVIDGRGTDYLTTVRDEVSARAGHAGPIVPGSDAELLLLPADPRVDATARRRPLGRVIGGAWRPSSAAVGRSKASATRATGGH